MILFLENFIAVKYCKTINNQSIIKSFGKLWF